MPEENEEKVLQLKDGELDNVSGGSDGYTGRTRCIRANSINCPGGNTRSAYESCEYFGTDKCIDGNLLVKYNMPIGPRYYRPDF